MKCSWDSAEKIPSSTKHITVAYTWQTSRWTSTWKMLPSLKLTVYCTPWPLYLSVIFPHPIIPESLLAQRTSNTLKALLINPANEHLTADPLNRLKPITESAMLSDQMFASVLHPVDIFDGDLTFLCEHERSSPCFPKTYKPHVHVYFDRMHDGASILS